MASTVKMTTIVRNIHTDEPDCQPGGQLSISSAGASSTSSGTPNRHGDGGMGGGQQRGGVAGRRATNSASSVVSMQQQQQQQSRNLKNPLAPSTKHQIMKGHSNQGVMSPPPLGSEPKMQQVYIYMYNVRICIYIHTQEYVSNLHLRPFSSPAMK